MLMGVLSLAGVGVAFLIRDRDAASTMHREPVQVGVDEGDRERAVATH